MKIAALFLILTAGVVQALTPDEFQALDFKQNLGESLSLNLTFQDENGEKVLLKNYFQGRPVIFVLGYSSCPMLCSLVLDGLVQCLQGLSLKAGASFDVVYLSIDPKETQDRLLTMKEKYLKRYGQINSEKGWHFLRGDLASINIISREIGFSYRYDVRSKQYAHPSGIVVVTSQGKVSQYFLGINYPSPGLAMAIERSAKQKTGTAVKKLLLLCFDYNPETGRYGNVILGSIRLLGILTILSLAVLIRKSHRERL
ncbi:MAG: SCO family protein [Verrucomicrobiae bacterium]|nr:SCO family protein [Verrucomicrobiae bacterium]